VVDGNYSLDRCHFTNFICVRSRKHLLNIEDIRQKRKHLLNSEVQENWSGTEIFGISTSQLLELVHGVNLWTRFYKKNSSLATLSWFFELSNLKNFAVAV
jgi:hypothetical protein